MFSQLDSHDDLRMSKNTLMPIFDISNIVKHNDMKRIVDYLL